MSCCKHSNNAKTCKRKLDGKIFNLPRKFTKKQCSNIRGFTMRSSCAPYKGCKGGRKKYNKAVSVLTENKNNITGKIYFSEMKSSIKEFDLKKNNIK